MISSLDFTENIDELEHIEYSVCPRSEQSDEAFRHAPIIYDNYMRPHMPSTLLLRYRATREFKSSVARKSQGDSPGTLGTRADHLVNFLAYLAEKRVLLRDLSFDHIRQYVDDMAQGRFSIKEQGKSLAVNTIIPRMQTAAMFGEFLHGVGVSHKFQLETIEVSKRVRGITSMAGRSVSGEILDVRVKKKDKDNALPLTYPLQGQLDEAVEICGERTAKPWLPFAVKAMYKVGFRRSEIQCSLPYMNSGLLQGRFQDGVRHERVVRVKVIGKGNKERVVEFPIDLYLQIRALIESYPRECQSPDLPVFLNLDARSKKSKKIAPRTLGDAFDYEFLPILAEVCGKEQSLTIHDLRHIC